MTPPTPSAPVVPGWAFADVWEAVAAARPEAPAVRHAGACLSWGGFERRAAGAACWLAAGGDRPTVAICSRNRPEQLVVVFAAFKVGARVVNTSFRYLRAELAANWRQSGAEVVAFDATVSTEVSAARALAPPDLRWLFIGPVADCPPWATVLADAERWDAVGDEGARPGGDDLVVLFTGGTTGASKGVLWRQDDLFVLLNRTARYPYDEEAGLPGVRAALERRPRQHIAVVAAPLAHGLGLLTSLSVLSGGGCVVLLSDGGFDAAELLDTAVSADAAEIVLVGDAHARPVLAALDGEPARWALPALRVIVSSGMRWSAEVKAGLTRHLPRVRCVDVLGSSEALRAARSVVGEAQGAGPGTVDFRLDDDTIVLDDAGCRVVPGSPRPGRVAVAADRGPLGYLDDEQATAATFVVVAGRRWTVLGDWATVAVDGSIILLGRGSAVINTGGEKVWAEEVEDALRSRPCVTDAVVVGVADARYGEQVIGLVERVGPGGPLSAVRNQLRHVLAHHKVPVALYEVPTVGRGPDGKLDRRRLAATAASLHLASEGESSHDR